MTTSEFHLTRPGALIAALPAVLGFVPEKSLVLVALEEGRMGAVMRADLSADLADHVGRLADLAATSGAETVVAVIVDADGALCPMCNDDHPELSDTLSESLQAHGIGLFAVHVVDRVEAGGTWRCIDGCGACCCRGCGRPPPAGFGSSALIDSAIRFVFRSTASTDTFTICPALSASAGSVMYRWLISLTWTRPS
jgi:hypothetical protein